MSVLLSLIYCHPCCEGLLYVNSCNAVAHWCYAHAQMQPKVSRLVMGEVRSANPFFRIVHFKKHVRKAFFKGDCFTSLRFLAFRCAQSTFQWNQTMQAFIAVYFCASCLFRFVKMMFIAIPRAQLNLKHKGRTLEHFTIALNNTESFL